MLKEKNLDQFSKNYRTFYPKVVTNLSKIWVWDPGSGKKFIPDPGSRGQKGTGSQIRIRNTGLIEKKNLNKDWNVARASPEQEAREWI